MVPMTSTRRWSSTPHEDRPATGPVRLRPSRSAPARADGCYRRRDGRGVGLARARVIAYAHQGGAWESPSSTLHAIAPRARGRAPPASSSTCTPPPTASWWSATTPRSTARPPATGPSPRFTLAELREMDFAYWWIPGADVTPGRPAGDYPFRGRAPRTAFGIATLREVLERFPGVVLNLDIKQTAPVVAPYEEALARLLAEFGRTDDVIVASFLDPATDAFRGFAPRSRPRPAPWPPPRPGGRCRPARTCPRSRRSPSRCPSARATSSSSTRASWRRPTGPAWRSTCGRSTTPSRWSG